MSKLTLEQFIELYGNCYYPSKDEYAPMDLTPKYLEILDGFDKHRYNVILKKTRQTGLTNLMVLYAAYTLLTGDGQTIVYVSSKFNTAKNFIKKLRVFFKHNDLDRYFGKINRTNRLDFNTNCIIGMAATPSSYRGYAADLVLVDEAAFIEKLKGFLSTVIPTIGGDGKIIIGSSPNGYEFFENIWSTDNGFNKNTMHWTDTTRFDDRWYEDMKKHSNKLQCRQELDGEFVDFVKEKSKTISLRVTEELFNNIDKRLLMTGESTSDYIRRLIESDVNGK